MTASTWAILTDTTRCIGCQQCVDACKRANDLGADEPRRWQRRIDDLSASRYTTIIRRPGDRFVRQQCRHCVQPACVSACLVGAMTKSPEGPVVYDSDRCMGCRYCMMACPYGVPRYDWDKPVPRVRKCTMCHEKIKAGELTAPACVGACPQQATIFGQRDELLAEARRRIEAEPKNYVQQVFGRTEVGGTSVLYVSDIPLDFLGFEPDMGAQPLPQRTWAALSKVPPVALGMAGLMTGAWWIIGRRMRLAHEQADAQAPPAPAEDSAPDPGPPAAKEGWP